MKNLNNLISICIFLSLLILSCKNKTSPTNNKTVEELTPQSAPKKQFPKSTINLQAKGDENAPQTILAFANEKQTHKIIEHHSCMQIESKDFEDNEIPSNADVACSCWWAGSGVKYYSINDEKGLQIYKKYTGEGDVDDWRLIYNDSLEEFIPEGHEIMDSYITDLNADDREDVLLVLKAINEAETSDIDNPTPRPLLILTRNTDNSLKLAHQNDQSVLCVNCGGVFGDPYDGIAIKGNYFSVQHFGGSNWKWTRIITYKYDEAKQNWFLHKDGGSNIAPDLKTEEWVYSTKDFGEIKFKDFNIYDNPDEVYSSKSETMTYESATVYAGSTDYYFKNSKGESVSFRVSNFEKNPNIKLPSKLLESVEEGPPGANPNLVGKKMEITFEGDQIQQVVIPSNKSDIQIGSSLQEVEKANGQSFMIVGFEIDRYLAGKVADWKGGALEKQTVQFEVTNNLPIEEYQQIMGDGLISSDHPVMQKAGLKVILVE